MQAIEFPFFEQSSIAQQKVLREFHARLVKQFGKPSPQVLPVMHELILTVLSQNTTDKNRDRAFNAMKEKYPKWEDVAEAEEKKLIEVLKPAGLAPQKAPRIQNIIRQAISMNDIAMEFLKKMDPHDAEEFLLALPGVGIKTAYCTMLFSCGMNVYPMDTHILRIFKRLSIIPKKPNVIREHRRISSLLAEEGSMENHLNVIKFGKEICKARTPICSACPVTDFCEHHSNLSQAGSDK